MQMLQVLFLLGLKSPRLRKLDIHNTPVNYRELMALALSRFPLEELNLLCCSIDDDALFALGQFDNNLRGLTKLSLGGNELTANGLFEFGAAGTGRFNRMVEVDLGSRWIGRCMTDVDGEPVEVLPEGVTNREAVEQCLAVLLRGGTSVSNEPLCSLC
jgi:hypothetical protein